MHKGALMASHLSSPVLVLFLLHFCLAAPGQPGTHRDKEPFTALANPFLSEEESHRLLKLYIDSILNTDGQSGPEINTWEQEVFFLFRLYDYDHSGFLDGLEMIKLLSDYNAHYRPGVVQSYTEVVSLVDFLLQTQDLNHDGLFSPSELLSPPLRQTQPEEAVKDQNEKAQNEMEIQMETQPQQENKIGDDDPLMSMDEQDAQQQQQQPEVPMTEQEDNMAAPVHQGQPEI